MSVQSAVTVAASPASLYVGDLHPDVSDANLIEAFSEFKSLASRLCSCLYGFFYGEISLLWLCQLHFSSRFLIILLQLLRMGRVSYGFVQYESEGSANAAIEKLNDTISDRVLPSPDVKYTKLYIKDLDWDITGDALQEKFPEFGKIVSLVVARDENGASRDFGFVNFENPDDAKKAMEVMNGSQFARAQKKAEREQILRHQFEERRKVQIMKYKASNVYVKNIDDEVTDEELREYFSQCGTITSAKLMRDNKGLSKGFGFVCFSSPEEAAKAVDTFHGMLMSLGCVWLGECEIPMGMKSIFPVWKEDRQAHLQLQYAQRMAGLAGPSTDIFPGGYPPVYYTAPTGVLSQVPPQPGVMYQPLGLRPGQRVNGFALPTRPAFQPPSLPMLDLTLTTIPEVHCSDPQGVNIHSFASHKSSRISARPHDFENAKFSSLRGCPSYPWQPPGSAPVGPQVDLLEPPLGAGLGRKEGNNKQLMELKTEESAAVPIRVDVPASDHSINEPTKANVAEKVQSAVLKKGSGRPLKEKAKSQLSGSSNRFEVLKSAEEIQNSSESSLRKPRAASMGVGSSRLNSPLKQNKVALRATQNNDDVLCLLETRVKADKAEAILATKFQNWNFCFNYEHASNGRIWVLWRKGINLSVIQKSDQYITVRGSHQGIPMLISAIYGSNDGIARRQLWQTLREVDHTVNNSPWVLGGDFNIIMHSYESSDHKHSFIEFTAPGVSDHCMSLTWLFKESLANRPKPFKFFNLWAAHPSFNNVVSQSWFQPTLGNLMQILLTKLKRLKVCLTRFNKENYSNLSDRVKLKRIELEHQQLLTLKGQENIEKELLLQEELYTLENAETAFLKQKTKVQWIKDGDKNSKFFYSTIAFKNKREIIRVLVDDQGNRLETFKAMSKEVISFYSNLIGTTDNMVKDIDPNLLKELLNYSMPYDASSSLVKEITREEIQKAVFCQGNDKALGPDGYTPFFFKNSWNIVGEDVVAAVKFFFLNTTIHPAFNSTIIALVPKIPNPSAVKDYRPISCCSVIYKIITKIIVRRLTDFLPEIITLNQTAFIRGMSIIDNTLLAQEMVKGYGRNSISPRCALKIDLHKAFDSIHWGFIIQILKALNLPTVLLNGLKHVSHNQGNVDSVVGVLTILDRFYEVSGLKLNPAKCTSGKVQINPQLVLVKNGSLWVAWLNAYVFKDRDFWNYQAIANLSWSIKRILKTRAEARPLISPGSVQVKEIWDVIRCKGQIVIWHKLIWFPLHIPKFNLIAWMALLNKLPTKDRLLRMGISNDNTCVNCNNSYESRDHLFSQCTLAVDLWNLILKLNGMQSTFLPWNEMLFTFCGKSEIKESFKAVVERLTAC
ncbi:putative FKBP-type peptidyl-prolyl cis-trans isomerase 1 [Hibiscus syriacus]|uniref:FKBP-type peptidyl-prolyl cis-trans isomerase 1 n=1 Tax=Hibiscus syriacus TaxID=106335 RepID=A0A6A3BQY8_HIBSY|nr:putative FKBP-type peptidyl-prolyl cis-trans isomerase 1 [Hibiscus syriacus]